MKIISEKRVDAVYRIISEKKVKATVYLDLGCNDGSITERIAEMVEAKEVYGVDIDDVALDKAKQRKIKTFKLDLSYDKIPLNNNSVDLVTALELIEHLINPDHILREVHRVLNSHGQFILSTPNLASYVNRLILLLGYQPYNVEVSTEFLAGVPLRAYTFTKPIGHIRPFTLRALKEVLSYHGFKIVKVMGAPGVEPKWLGIIDKLFSLRASLARRLIVFAMKI
jgi:ubiquinone/menaquinone biosynthesis C-methylase UbiE